MARFCVKLCVFIFIGLMLAGCATKKTQQRVDAGETKSNGSGSNVSPIVNATPASALELDEYMEELVDNFEVIIDASASEFLPYDQQIKLNIAKKVLTGFNKHTPDRRLFGGLRRYGFEAGAFTEKTALMYGITEYDRQDFGHAIKSIRWAGGKSPMALAIDKASDDMQIMEGYLALVIISDGKIMRRDKDPIAAAKAMKDRYGDRLCIYTCLVGDDMKYDPNTYHDSFQLMDQIAQVGGCGYLVTADEVLASDKNMADWVDDIFTRRRRFKPEPREIECVDKDQDGVCDDVDECPGTPKGARVDERGCWILERVQFDLNKWDIKPQYYPIIDEVARVMKLNPWLKIEVQGHTCTIWTEQYNMKLSHWRAMSVTSYLMKKGVSPQQISVKGYGFSRPTASNRTEEGRSLNRRAEFKRLN